MNNNETQSTDNQEIAETTVDTIQQPIEEVPAAITNHTEPQGKKNVGWMITSGVLGVAFIVTLIIAIVNPGQSKILATVNGNKITQEDFFATLDKSYASSVESILDRMISEEVLAQEADAQNVTLTNKDIDNEVAAMKLQYSSEEEYQSFLSYYGMTEADLRNELELSALVRLLLQDEITVSEEDMKAYFDANIEKMGGSDEKVRASHILVADKETAEDIISQLDNGADFATLAGEYGTDATAANGGDLDFFTRADMITAFSDAAFALEVGEYTKEPVQSEYGYHVILKTDYQPAVEANYDNVKDAIKTQLVNEQIYTNYSTYLDDLEAKSTIVNSYLDSKSSTTDAATDTTTETSTDAPTDTTTDETVTE